MSAIFDKGAAFEAQRKAARDYWREVLNPGGNVWRQTGPKFVAKTIEDANAGRFEVRP